MRASARVDTPRVSPRVVDPGRVVDPVAPPARGEDPPDQSLCRLRCRSLCSMEPCAVNPIVKRPRRGALEDPWWGSWNGDGKALSAYEHLQQQRLRYRQSQQASVELRLMEAEHRERDALAEAESWRQKAADAAMWREQYFSQLTTAKQDLEAAEARAEAAEARAAVAEAQAARLASGDVDLSQCVVCMERRRSHAGRCGHLCLCEECASGDRPKPQRLTKCPICRCKLRPLLKVVFS